MDSMPFFLRCEYSIRIEHAKNDIGREFHCYCYQTAKTSMSVFPFESFAKSAEKIFSLLQDICVLSVNLEILIKSKLFLNGLESDAKSLRLITKEVGGDFGTVFLVKDANGEEGASHISVVKCLETATEDLFGQFGNLELEPGGTLLEILVESCGTGVRAEF